MEAPPPTGPTFWVWWKAGNVAFRRGETPRFETCTVWPRRNAGNGCTTIASQKCGERGGPGTQPDNTQRFTFGWLGCLWLGLALVSHLDLLVWMGPARHTQQSRVLPNKANRSRARSVRLVVVSVVSDCRASRVPWLATRSVPHAPRLQTGLLASAKRNI